MKYIIKWRQRFLPKTLLSTLKCNYCQESHCLRTSTRQTHKEPVILGIETSCDDTGAAIVDGEGRILGEGYFSQVSTSVRFGGVLPSMASKLHSKNIELAAKEAFEKSRMQPADLTAIAATVKPGNIRSLRIGAKYAKELALANRLPLIPIHHMEAHALTARMLHQIEFPFLALLISGGHTMLVLASNITDWKVLGNTSDVAIGVALDHIARRLKLKNIPGMSEVAGGRAIEMLAKEGDPKSYECPNPMSTYNNATFSFSGLTSWMLKIISILEEEQGIEGGRVLPQVPDLCASFQYSVTKHLIRRTHRALRFIEYAELGHPEKNSLVISGGVASNQFIRKAFEKLCNVEDYHLYVPPPRLCTDNGVMVAWNGVERWKENQGILHDEEAIRKVAVEARCPLGPDLTQDYRMAGIPKPAYIKF